MEDSFFLQTSIPIVKLLSIFCRSIATIKNMLVISFPFIGHNQNYVRLILDMYVAIKGKEITTILFFILPLLLKFIIQLRFPNSKCTPLT